MSSWEGSACYPRSTFYPLSDGLPCGTTGSLCSSFLPDRLVCLPVKRPYAITLCDRLPIGLRAPLEASVTLFGGDHPSQTTRHTVSPFNGLGFKQPKPVFQRRLHWHWRARFIASGLSYTSVAQTQCKAIVKVHGVFSSHRG